MTVGEFKKTEQYKHATDIYYLNMNGEEVSGLPEIILNNLDIIGCASNADGTIIIDLYC